MAGPGETTSPDVDLILRRYGAAKTLRGLFEADWRDSAALVSPAHFAGWNGGQGAGITGASNRQYARNVRARVFDDTGMRALPKYAAVLDRILTPSSTLWHDLQPSDPSLARKKAVQDYFTELNRVLFQKRYEPDARYIIAQSENYMSLGMYGNGVKFLDARRPARPGQNAPTGLLYRPIALSSVYVLENADGEIDNFFRRMDLTSRQAVGRFRDKAPKAARDKVAKGLADADTDTSEYVHCVMPNNEYDASALGLDKSSPWSSVYIHVDTKAIVDAVGGYSSKPFTFARDTTVAGVVYGWGPAARCYASMASMNVIGKSQLKQAQLAAEPALLAYDDGVMNGQLDIRPGAVNIGGIDSQGRKLVQALDTGRFDIAREILLELRSSVNDAFFVSLFQMFKDRPQMTATEVLQMAAEQAALLAPTMGRQQSEDLSPTIEREIDILTRQGVLPEAPPELVEAEDHYKIVYTSPMARAMGGEAVTSFFQLAGLLGEFAKATGDASVVRRLNPEAAVPEIAQIKSVPSTWLRSDAQMQEMAEADKAAADTKTAVDAAPAIASVAKQAMPMAAAA